MPYWRPPDCESCAIYFPRSAIDSIRMQKPDDVRTGIAIGAITVMLWVIIWLGNALAGMST